MDFKYEFFIAGKTRNKENILKICDIFDKYNIPYYCFIKDEASMGSFGAEGLSEEEQMKIFESLDLRSDVVVKIFKDDLDAERASRNLLLVLPAGKSGHMEAGIAYGWGHKCYAIGETEGTDSLYNIFEEIFKDNNELEEFLKNYK
ncbi:MAG: hypothetical protein IKQ06_01390 [Bacilli bacterium]|nr:hypothetical protein [Bacilli bacterium]